MSEQPNPSTVEVRVTTTQSPLRLIGEEWVQRGYTSYQYNDPPDPCIIDGTPMNACTGDTH